MLGSMKFLALSAAAVSLWVAQAQAQDVHVFVSRGAQAVVQEILPQVEKAMGHKAVVEYNSSTEFKAKIEKGEAFDAAIVSTELMEELVKNGTIVAASRKPVARAGIGVGVRTGAAKPDIKTSDALKQALLKAKAITYAEDGASRPYLERMFDRMGISAEMSHKVVLAHGSALSAAKVADGSADYLLTLISEILQSPGLELVGPLPQEHQNYISFAAGVNAKAHDPASAKKLVEAVTKPEILPVLKAKGMEPLK